MKIMSSLHTLMMQATGFSECRYISVDRLHGVTSVTALVTVIRMQNLTGTRLADNDARDKTVGIVCACKFSTK